MMLSCTLSHRYILLQLSLPCGITQIYYTAECHLGIRSCLIPQRIYQRNVHEHNGSLQSSDMADRVTLSTWWGGRGVVPIIFIAHLLPMGLVPLIRGVLNKLLYVRIVISFRKKSLETALAELSQDLSRQNLVESGNNPL